MLCKVILNSEGTESMLKLFQNFVKFFVHLLHLNIQHTPNTWYRQQGGACKALILHRSLKIELIDVYGFRHRHEDCRQSASF